MNEPKRFEVVSGMKLSAFSLLLVLISVALVTASLVGHFRDVQYLTEHQYWLAIGGFAVMVFGVIFKGQ